MRSRLVCKNLSCPAYEHVASMTADEVLHCECGARLEISVGAPNVIWTGSIGQRYRDKGSQGYHDPDGQWAYTRKTPDGKPKAVRLETWQDVHEYSKREGCYDPRELPRNAEISADGKSLSSRGMPGQEI